MDAQTLILPLNIEQLCYQRNGQILLRDISLSLQAGQRSIILGPNGAGKSLLLRLCHGLLKPSSGELRWHDQSLQSARRQQAMVFQKPVLLRRTVAANIDYALAVKSTPRSQRAERVQQALALVGLEQLAQRPARVLSGGEQQRLALARAWAQQPQVLLLDEPTANLDPAAVRKIEQALGIIQDAGTKIIMTTHDLAQARRLADDIVFLHRGELYEHTPAQVFFVQPKSTTAARFLRGELLA